MPDLSQEKARDFIAEVREGNGGITPEDQEFLNAHRPSVLRALQKTRRQLADSIKIVVDNLYSKETRFLYELIQNAEDNSYSTATADGEEPFLAFKVYPDRIIIDSNEDGFSESNIRAICSVGNSTKKHSAGYIGEKGIGFKSVFKIAQKVHIQSGPFSFAFSHTREDDDDGLGMITPYYESAQELPMGVRTRMILNLLDSSKFEERACEFRNVPDTFLMFLSQLQRLSIELNQPGKAPTATQYTKQEAKENGLYTTFLGKTTRKGKEESASEQKYYTMKSDLHGLPFDEARKDKQGNSIDRATVILAFPVDEHDEPVIKQQYTYAFLPLRRVGFRFLIQADLITQANREDVVHSNRNRAILKGVAKAFANAVVVFCKRPSLRYQWMRYLPEDFITDEFWGTLWTLVSEELKQTPLLEPWSGNGLYKPSDLQKLPEDVIAEDGSPLLPDLEGAEIYLSPKYVEADFQILKRLGTTKLQRSKFLDRLEADLCNPGGSNWKSMEKNADWRTRICKLLSRTFSENFPNEQNRLKKLALIPLLDGRWVSSTSGIKTYFPKTEGISIPTDLGLDLISLMATQNVAWADLLLDLGVMSCPQDFVISSILKRYNARTLDNFTLSNAVAHIRYLYWFLPNDQPSLAPQIRLVNQHRSLLKIHQYLYFPDEEDNYSPSKLFEGDAKLPGLPLNYLNGAYLKAVDPEVIRNGRPWIRWLEVVVGVRRRPELHAEDSDRLSREFQYLVNHRSNMLMGTLKCGWTQYCRQIKNVAKEELQNSAVLLENGRRECLLRTFLPLPKLKQIAAELRIADAYPFIALSELLRDGEILEWKFVKDLQIGIEENLDFYLSALETFRTINPALNNTSAGDQLARIYQNIQSKSSEGLDRVRDIFKHPDAPVIWIPPSNRIDSTWLSAADCVWDGPHWLKSKQCLKVELYLQLEHLFKVSLSIPDASQIDVVNDLLMLKSGSGERTSLRSQSTTFGQPKIGTTGTPYQVTLGKVSEHTMASFQSVTFMEAYKNQSFEELRLTDYDMGKRPLSTKTSPCKSKAFTGLEADKIICEAEKRYDYLWKKSAYPKDGEKSESQKALQSTFENSALVYIPKENAWRPPSQCVWVEASVKIPRKASIADAYPLKKTFFTTVLKISVPTVEMYIDSLKAEAIGKASAAQIKETMKLICGLGVGESDLSSLIEAKILPIKHANGVGSFASASSTHEFVDFAIVENTIHWEAFTSKIVILDFSLEEIRDTRPLLLAIGLENRFSSKLVKEITEVSGGSQDHEMTRNLRIKSQAIVRCALHFTSLDKRQDVAVLYGKFKRAIVYVSDSIRCSLQITQNGRSIEGASSRANFHFEEADGALRLYLPKDEVERDVCFESDLPRRLCTFLRITDPGAPGVVGSVFRKDNPAVIDKILENAGVGQIHCDFDALDEEFQTSDAGSDVETLVEAGSNIRLYTPSLGTHPYTPSDGVRRRERQSGSVSAEDLQNKIVPQPSYQERQIDAQETAYRRILENVVDVARQRASSGVFESMGLSVRGPVGTTVLPQEIVREAFATRTLERDFKVGAAGELYMFEYLKALGLPRFGLDNWKSEIRDRVKIHAEYHDLEKDHDRSAIADIEYLDDSLRLTQFLTQKGHLAQGLLDGEKPLYHIEIKTTTSSDWQEPFFMSKAQERHIKGKHIEDGKSRSSVYVICRIFNLGKGDETGMHIYLDPETKRRNRELEFSTHTWAVKPLTQTMLPVGKPIVGGSAAQTTSKIARTTQTGGVTGTKDAQNESVLPSFPNFGSSATNNVPKSGTSAFGSPRVESQNQMKPPGSGLFGSDWVPSGNNASTKSSPGGSLFGTNKPSSAVGIFGSSRASPNSDTSKTPSLGLFGSNDKSSNSDVSKTTPAGGSLFGSAAIPSNSNASRATPTGGLFGSNAKSSNSSISKTTAAGGPLFGFAALPSNSDALRATPTGGLFGSITKSSNSGISTTTPTGGPLFGSAALPSNSDASRSTPAGGLFSSNTKSSNSGISKTTPTGGPLFGSAAIPSNSDASRSTPAGGLFSSNTKSSNSGISKTTPTGGPLFGSAAIPSNSDVSKTTPTGGPFGSAAISSNSNVSRATPTSGLLGSNDKSSHSSISKTTPAGGPFGSAALPSNNDVSRTTPAGGLFGSAAISTNSDVLRATPTGGLFGSNDKSSNIDVSKTIPASNPFGSAVISSSSDVSKTISASNPFGSAVISSSNDVSKTTLTSGLFGSAAISNNSDVSRATPTGGLFGSAAISSDNYVSKNIPGGGLFGSSAMSTNDQTSKASSTDSLFGTTTNSDAAKSTSPNMTGAFGFAPYTSTHGNAPSTKGLFGMSSGSPIRNSLKSRSARRYLGTKAVSPNTEPPKSTSSTVSLPAAGSLSSSTTGGLFGTDPNPFKTQTGGLFGTKPSLSNTQTTAIGISTPAAQPSSSTTTGSVFGTPTTSTDSGPCQSATGFRGFGSSSSTPRSEIGGFGTNATTSTSQDMSRSTKPTPTTSSFFSESGVPSTNTAFGSPSNPKTAIIFQQARLAVPSVLKSADSAARDSRSPSPVQTNCSKPGGGENDSTDS